MGVRLRRLRRCSRISNCLAVVPLETPTDKAVPSINRRAIRTSHCLQGFCPQLCDGRGARLRRGCASIWTMFFAAHADPILPSAAQPYNLLVTGVGGMGSSPWAPWSAWPPIWTNKGVSVLDMTGLAQKYGAVFSHLRVADWPRGHPRPRIATGEAHAILGATSS